VSYDAIVPPSGLSRQVPWFAQPARGPHPGGVLSDADGRVLVNFLQQDLDSPPDSTGRPGAIPAHAQDVKA
jgi:hypothetical protein